MQNLNSRQGMDVRREDIFQEKSCTTGEIATQLKVVMDLLARQRKRFCDLMRNLRQDIVGCYEEAKWLGH